MRRYAIRHETVYGYRAPVDIGLHVLRLTPLTIRGQRSRGQTLSVAPAPARQRMFVDHFGNVVHHIAIETTHSEFSVVLEATVEVTRGEVAEAGPEWESVRDGDAESTASPRRRRSRNSSIPRRWWRSRTAPAATPPRPSPPGGRS